MGGRESIDWSCGVANDFLRAFRFAATPCFLEDWPVLAVAVLSTRRRIAQTTPKLW